MPTSSMTASSTPALRQLPLNDKPIAPDGRFVLYWMIAQRRLTHTFALQFAAEQAVALGLPLLVFEPLRVGYPWASDRLHRFILDGMRDHLRALEPHPHALYYPYVEAQEDDGKGLLEALAERAALVVTDDYPCFFIPSMLRAAARQLAVPLIAVDSNGLLPLRATERTFTTAYSFRRALHKTLPPHLSELPLEDPLAALAPPPPTDALRDHLEAITRRWPAADPALLNDRSPERLAHLPIDHQVGIVPAEGGEQAAKERLARFLDEKLDRYPEERNDPDARGASGFSPYLHFGHLSTHEIFAQLCKKEDWDPSLLSDKPTGQREGWWNMSAAAEAFLDELVTWREIGFNMTATAPRTYSSYDSLPDFAKQTLDDHRHDPRPHLYTYEELAQAKTADRLWNAAQNELLQTGSIHNYMRMLWGKKILEWTESPEQALEFMIELNNTYAIDGRDPNSYSGIFWCLGRYDRGWAERPTFGKVRYMSSENTARKLDLTRYLETYAPLPKRASAKSGAKERRGGER